MMRTLTPSGKKHFAAAIALASTPALALPTVVTNGANDGEGSLRAALDSGAREILVTTQDDILITGKLVYAGAEPLAIYGSGQTVRAHEDFTLLELSQGASLKIIGLNFEGPGGFDIENQSDDPGAAGKGIFVDVRDNQEGTVNVELTDVLVRGVANHGVHVSDCDLADACGGGGGGAGGGSNAGIRVTFNRVTVEDVGNGRFDADGLRVDERGNGGIHFTAHDSAFRYVGADGVELDEGQNGGVSTTVTHSTFEHNGNYCNPDLLEPQLEAFLDGAPDEDEFDEADAVTEGDLPGPVTGTLDDACLEYAVDLYDSGFVAAYEYAIDVDDGYDIDEAGNGSIKAVIVDSSIEENLDEGLDVDEEDNGGIELIAVQSSAGENADDGYKLSEADNGGIESALHRVELTSNGGKGGVFEEEDKGDVNVLVDQSFTRDNDDGDDTGIEVVQEDKGDGTLTLRDSTLLDGYDAEGVTVIEK